MANGILLPHPKECEKFIECHNSRAYTKTCPPETSFDINSRRCFGSSIVNCGGRKRSVENNFDIFSEEFIANVSCKLLSIGEGI